MPAAWREARYAPSGASSAGRITPLLSFLSRRRTAFMTVPGKSREAAAPTPSISRSNIPKPRGNPKRSRTARQPRAVRRASLLRMSRSVMTMLSDLAEGSPMSPANFRACARSFGCISASAVRNSSSARATASLAITVSSSGGLWAASNCAARAGGEQEAVMGERCRIARRGLWCSVVERCRKNTKHLSAVRSRR